MKRSKVTYTHSYCEENIYKLLETVSLAIEIQRRKEATGTSTGVVNEMRESLTAAGAGKGTTAVETIALEPREFCAASAVFISAYHEDCQREKKNQWSSQIPICTEDVLNILGNSSAQPSRGGRSAQDVFTLWDYHVVALLYHTANAMWYVVDLDTKVGQPHSPTLPDSPVMCVRADLYARISFVPQDSHRRFTQQSTAILSRIAERTCFRVVDAVEYMKTFRSDRTHMLVKRGNGHLAEYHTPPPTYPCIVEASPVAKVVGGSSAEEQQNASADASHKASWRLESNLVSFINMDNTTTVPGRILTRDAFLHWCSSPEGPPTR